MKNIKDLTIGTHKLSIENKPYIIAEIGSNFDQNFNKACKLIELAKESGANAVKFQLFRAEALYPEKNDLYKIFNEIQLDSSWIEKLKNHAELCKVDFLASAFDPYSFEILEKNNVIAHKIASSETTNLGFVNKVAKTGKPLLISTGMCDFVDVEEAINISYASNNFKICIMQCGSVYPLNYKDTNLNVIKAYKKRFGHIVGFSDHTLDNIAATTAVGLGARVFEKHITLNKTDKGPDHFYALEPQEFKSYVSAINNSFLCLGSKDKFLLDEERKLGRREGIYLSREIQKGDLIKKTDLIIKRPALGIRSRYINYVIGSKAAKDLKKDQFLNFEDLNI